MRMGGATLFKGGATRVVRVAHSGLAFGQGFWHNSGMLAWRASASLLALAFYLSTPAHAGQAEGMYAQARAMLDDKSIQDVSTVPELLERCVEEGFAPAEFLLLDVYEGQFKGLEPQPRKAATLAYRLASAPETDGREDSEEEASMRAEAMYRYAMYRERGFGCEASATDAYRWMRQAASMGLSRARVELARYLMQGKGHAPLPGTALRLLLSEQRVSPETPNLYFYLGTMCAQGLGFRQNKPNWPMALRFFEQGAAQGDARAMNNLGAFYERGIVVSQDTAQALRFYRKAAALGDKNASANWQRLAYKSGIKADTPGGSSFSQRVDRALVRVIHTLPVTEKTRNALCEPFLPPLHREEDVR